MNRTKRSSKSLDWDMTPPPPLEKFQTEADCFFRWLPLSWSYSYGYGYGYGYSFITFINWIMSVPWLESGSTENTSIRSREFPRAAPSGTPSTSCWYFPVLPSSRLGTDSVQYSTVQYSTVQYSEKWEQHQHRTSLDQLVVRGILIEKC